MLLIFRLAILQQPACFLQFPSPLLPLRNRKGGINTRDCKVPATLMEAGPVAHVAQGGARPCGSLRYRQGAVGQSRALPDAATPPLHLVSRRQPRGDRRRRGPSAEGTRAHRPSFVSPSPPLPTSPAQRGGGSATAVLFARGPRPKPGTIGGGAQSPPCPPPLPPRSPPRRNMAARPPLPPSSASPPAPRSQASGWAREAPRRNRGRHGPAPRATAREVESLARGLPTRVNKAHAEWGWRPGRAAPSSRALRPPSRA